MISIHHDLDLLYRADGGRMRTWHRHPLATGDVSYATRTSQGPRALTGLVDLALGWYERARQRRALRTLDDRMLSDIGVGRSAAEEEARKPFWQA